MRSTTCRSSARRPCEECRRKVSTTASRAPDLASDLALQIARSASQIPTTYPRSYPRSDREAPADAVAAREIAGVPWPNLNSAHDIVKSQTPVFGRDRETVSTPKCLYRLGGRCRMSAPPKEAPGLIISGSIRSCECTKSCPCLQRRFSLRWPCYRVRRRPMPGAIVTVVQVPQSLLPSSAVLHCMRSRAVITAAIITARIMMTGTATTTTRAAPTTVRALAGLGTAAITAVTMADTITSLVHVDLAVVTDTGSPISLGRSSLLG